MIKETSIYEEALRNALVKVVTRGQVYEMAGISVPWRTVIADAVETFNNQLRKYGKV